MAALPSALGQVITVYDQMSYPGGLVADVPGIFPIQTNAPLGQTFVPNLAQVGFVELYLSTWRGQFPDLHVETQRVSVALREGSISGTILGESDTVTINYNPPWSAFVERFGFPQPVTVTPGQTYVFEVCHEGGDDLIGLAFVCPHLVGQDYYPRGTYIQQGQLWPSGLDIWFREGVLVVPEPRAWALMPLAAAALLVVKRRWRRPCPRPDRPA